MPKGLYSTLLDKPLNSLSLSIRSSLPSFLTVNSSISSHTGHHEEEHTDTKGIVNLQSDAPFVLFLYRFDRSHLATFALFYLGWLASSPLPLPLISLLALLSSLMSQLAFAVFFGLLNNTKKPLLYLVRLRPE